MAEEVIVQTAELAAPENVQSVFGLNVGSKMVVGGKKNYTYDPVLVGTLGA